MTKNRSDYSVLLVDDDKYVLDGLAILLEEDYSLKTASSGSEALRIVADDDEIAVVVLDIKMPGMDGIECAREIRKLRPELPVIFHTGFPGLYSENEISRLEQPFDYVEKGSAVSRLCRSVHNAFEGFLLKRQVADSRLESSHMGLVGESLPMQAIRQAIIRVAPTDTKVMILGDTGTGKELVARALYRLSNRSHQRLAIFNCNHKAPDLAESELFGHSKGAFTGAVADRVGLFEYADGGTVFLDEIGDLDITTQAKILRVLESGEYQTVGDTPKLRTTDVRVLCATHRNLEQIVSEGKFREDLYYRLKGVVIKLPTLRERKEDIPLLVSRLVDRLTVGSALMPQKMFDRSAVDALMEQDWPGNVRELFDVVEALLILTDSDIIMDSDVETLLGGKMSDRPISGGLSQRTNEYRKNLIISALQDTNGNVAAAARILEIDPANLRKLIKSLGIRQV